MLHYLIFYAGIMLFIFLGIFLANTAIELGLLKYMSKPFEPLTRAAKLPNDAASIPAIFLLNPTAAHAALASLLKKKIVGEKEAIAIVLISSGATRIRVLFQYYLPIVVPVLGFTLSSKYIAFSFIGTILTIIIGFLYGRLMIVNGVDNVKNVKNMDDEQVSAKFSNKGGEQRIKRREAINKAFVNTLKMIKGIYLRLGIAIIILMILIHFNAFEELGKYISPFFNPIGLSTQSIVVISTQIANPTVGLIMAGEMFRSGFFTPKEVLLTLFVGLLLFVSIVDFPKNVFPILTSIYGIKFGSKLFTIEFFVFIFTTLFIITLIYFLM